MSTPRHTYAGSPQHFNGSMGEQGEGQQGMMGDLQQRMQSAGEQIQSQAQHYVEDYPLTTVLTCFGIGLGVGVVLGSAIMSSMSSEPEPESYMSRARSWLPAGGSAAAHLPSAKDASSWFSSMSGNVAASPSNWYPSNWGDNLVQGAKNMAHRYGY
jgi:hypothetical protein